MLRNIAEKSSVTLNLELCEDLSASYVDERLIFQSVSNLVSNAVKFTDSGGTVTIGSANFNDHIEITVSDTGIGMNEAQCEKVLQPFEQVADVMSRNKDGTGLGLPIVNGIIKEHGGSFTLASVVNQGTVATIALDLNWLFIVQILCSRECLSSCAPLPEYL